MTNFEMLLPYNPCPTNRDIESMVNYQIRKWISKSNGLQRFYPFYGTGSVKKTYLPL